VFARSSLVAVVSFGIGALGLACAPDALGPAAIPGQAQILNVDPSSASVRAANAGLSSLAGDRAQQIRWAVQGRRLRRGQDDMLRIEAVVPGFAGYYVDENEQIVLLQKSPSPASAQTLRKMVYDTYSTHPSAIVRAIMARASNAMVQDAVFSLSELVAWERTVLEKCQDIPGCNGTGVSVVNNKLTVTVDQAENVTSTRVALAALGIPPEAQNIEISGPVVLTVVRWTDVVRPTRGGIMVTMHGAPGWPDTVQLSESHGFNVQLSDQPGTPTQFLTSGHAPNEFNATNGHLGDQIYQASYFLGHGVIGTITTNPPWETATCLPGYQYCTQYDGALGTFSAGVSGDRRIGTSRYEGDNGQVGTQEINNWYPIVGTLEPDQVTTNPTGVHKSGYRTGTTTGAMTETYYSVQATNFPWGFTGHVSVLFWGFARVSHMGWGGGDSGAPVFARTTACGVYCAIGLQSGGQGSQDLTTGICNAGLGCSVVISPLSAIEQGLHMGRLNPRTTP